MRGGAYRILGPLGTGGMGALYLAADTGAFDRRCVVKELLDYYDPTDPAEAHRAQERFQTEARLLAELSHPGIPRIYSYFSEAGRHYIVMEYIEGETLERAITHVDAHGKTVPAHPLPAEEVVRHAVRICQVLEYLADRPIPVVHHDIKPANLIVDRTSGEVRLVDFGTAQTRARWITQSRLGQGGASLYGTQGYAAPEQYQGHSDPRSDVYSLAATIYHLLSDDDPGDHPFHFPRMGALQSALAGALTRALHLEVNRRSTAQEFREALENWLIPEEAAQPFVFRSGAAARTTSELVTLSERYWSEAREYLGTGDFEQWFRGRNRHDLIARAKSARLERDADAALEAFLRRLNPRLPPPRLVVEPPSLKFGRVVRQGTVVRHLLVRNQGRGYGQAGFRASVPWLSFEQERVGCLTDSVVSVSVQMDAAQLPLRRQHRAVITCTPSRGSRVSIPVEVELSLAGEALRRIAGVFRGIGHLNLRGGRRALSWWRRILQSMRRSRYGMWILLALTIVLGGAVVAFWWSWHDQMPDLKALSSQGAASLVWDFLQALPLGVVVVYLLLTLALVGGGIAWETVMAMVVKVAGRRRGDQSP